MGSELAPGPQVHDGDPQLGHVKAHGLAEPVGCGLVGGESSTVVERRLGDDGKLVTNLLDEDAELSARCRDLRGDPGLGTAQVSGFQYI